jgi:hypothetical protein
MLPTTRPNDSNTYQDLQIRANRREFFIKAAVITDVAILAIAHFVVGSPIRPILNGVIAGNVIAYCAVRYFSPDELL